MSDMNKFYRYDKIVTMYADDILSKGDMLDLCEHNANLFIKLLLNIPYDLSPNQKWILDEFYDPANEYNELVLIAGRKGGKTDMASVITLFQVYKLLQIPNPQKKFGIIGRKPIYAINIGTSKDEALGVAFGTIKSLVDTSWYFKQYKKDEKIGEIIFPHNIRIHCMTSSARSVKGFANIVNLYDEACHYVDTHGNLSADEIYESNHPNLDPLLPLSRSIIISSPAGKQGKVWELFRKGKAAHILQPQPEHGEEPWRMVAQFKTWELNKNPFVAFESKKMQEELQRNPDRFAMERGALFCDVISPAILYEFVRLCAGGSIEKGNRMIGKAVRDKKTMRIVAGDAAYSGDSYALGMGHMEGDVVVIDYIQYWKGDQQHPIDITQPETQMLDFHDRFYVRYFVLDKFQSVSTIQRLKKKGLPIYGLPPKGVSETKYNQMSYEYMLDRINLQKIRLPWHATLLGEFQFLQRKVRSTSVRYEAAQGHRDDGTDVVARIVILLEQFGRRRMPRVGWEK